MATLLRFHPVISSLKTQLYAVITRWKRLSQHSFTFLQRKTWKRLLRFNLHGSISPTFYARLFRTKVSREAFLCLPWRLNFLFAQEYWRNCANKMLVKLTPGVDFINIYTRLFCAQNLTSFWRIATGKWHTAFGKFSVKNLANLAAHFEVECWWN